jgi:Family of unknown function (DUF5681)
VLIILTTHYVYGNYAGERKTEIAKSDYEVGYRKPPRYTQFKKGEPSANPRGRPAKNLAALVAAGLDEPVTVTENGKTRTISKRQVVAKQLINKSASADLRAIKMLVDIMKDAEKQTTAAQPAEDTYRFIEADEQVLDQLIERLRGQILFEMENKEPE